MTFIAIILAISIASSTIYYFQKDPVGKAYSDFFSTSPEFESQEEEVAAYMNLLGDMANQRDGAKNYLRDFHSLFKISSQSSQPSNTSDLSNIDHPNESAAPEYTENNNYIIDAFKSLGLNQEEQTKRKDIFQVCMAQYMAIRAIARSGAQGTEDYNKLIQSYAKTCLKAYYQDQDSLVRNDTGLFFGGFGIAPVLPNYFRGAYNEVYQLLSDAWPDSFGGVKYNGVPHTRFDVPQTQQGYSWEQGYSGGPMAIGMIRGFPIVYYIQESNSQPHIQFIPDYHHLASTLNRYHFVMTYPGGTAWNVHLLPIPMKWQIINLPTFQLTGSIKWCPGAGTIAIMTAGGGPAGLLAGIGMAVKCVFTGPETIVRPTTVREYINESFFEHILYGQVDAMGLSANRWGLEGPQNKMVGVLRRNVFLDSIYKLILERRIQGKTHKGEVLIHCSDQWDTTKNIIKWMIFVTIEKKLNGINEYFAREAVELSAALGTIDKVLDHCFKPAYTKFCTCIETYQKQDDFSSPDSFKRCCDEDYIDYDEVQTCLESISPHWMWTVFKFINPSRLLRITWLDMFHLAKAIGIHYALPKQKSDIETALSDSNCAYAMIKDGCYCAADTAAYYGWFLEEMQSGQLGINDIQKLMALLSGTEDSEAPVCTQSFANKCKCESLDRMYSCETCWAHISSDDSSEERPDIDDCTPDPTISGGCLTEEQYQRVQYMLPCEGYEDCNEYVCDPLRLQPFEDCSHYENCDTSPCEMIYQWFVSEKISFDALVQLFQKLDCSPCLLGETLKGMVKNGLGGYTPDLAYTGMFGKGFYRNFSTDCNQNTLSDLMGDEKWEPHPKWLPQTIDGVLSICPEIRSCAPCCCFPAAQNTKREDAVNQFSSIIQDCIYKLDTNNQCQCQKLYRNYIIESSTSNIDYYINAFNAAGCPGQACNLLTAKYRDLIKTATRMDEFKSIFKQYQQALNSIGCEDQLAMQDSIENIIHSSIEGFTRLVIDLSIILRELPYISY